MEEGTALAIALPQLGKWRQWTIDEQADQLLVTVKSFTEAEAHEIVERDAADLADEDREERIRRILQSVNLRLFEYFEISIGDVRAARWITLGPRAQD
jgi:hypothetical protein